MQRLSVITITRNDLEGLKRTINSVKNQSFENIEHIIIDADSTDGTKDFLNNQPNLKFISEPDDGRYDGMNKGASHASGEIIWFLHSADIFPDTDTAKFVMEKVESTHGNFRWGYGLSSIEREGIPLGIGGQVPFDLTRFLLGGRIIPHQAAVFDSEFFADQGGYNIKFGLAEDQAFMARCAVKSLPLVWPRTLCVFDADGAGSTRGAFAHYRDMGRARRGTGVSVTGKKWMDSVLSFYFAINTKKERLERRIVSKLSPTASILEKK
ncbi:glycosyltransferase family 2 protein [Paeniglutamicibacter sp. Y32M11]|uniref:glycosyltransferase family 2 protein n=1 Tax=Paeniglutamicibacter sp. Y32M11 TaxID=2853258 RepID=UPI001C531481|nr:glycosyltransferase family 2 protein [Paeniglutamicibacter sp. Y32M11]QXQ09641.1 glycosyltransferase [Paeniglutamicibacter sp. Y32M11]